MGRYGFRPVAVLRIVGLDARNPTFRRIVRDRQFPTRCRRWTLQSRNFKAVAKTDTTSLLCCNICALTRTNVCKASRRNDMHRQKPLQLWSDHLGP